MDLSIINISIEELCGLGAIVLLVVAQCIYSLRRKFCLRNWLKHNRFSTEDVVGQPPVSVVVFANRENGEGLTDCVHAIMNQCYSEFEVIVVNADSASYVDDAVTLLSMEFAGLRSTFIPDTNCNVSLRKLSTMLGVKAAKHDVVVFIDADCRPASPYWLASMTRHFDDSVGVVVGFTAVDDDCDTVFGHRYRAFDTALENSQYLAAAIRGNAYRGNRCNMAYRKSLFFKNKGFSETMNLKYGDDDLFVAELARLADVVAEISPESVVVSKPRDYRVAYEFGKYHRYFTQSKLRPAAESWSVAMSIVRVPYLLAVAAALAWAVWCTVGGDYVRAAIVGGSAVALYIAEQLVYIFAQRKIALILSCKKLFLSIPIFRFLRPYVNFGYKARASHVDNYTWQ
ncbi:MAG: glycosyltransferase [Candidatus Limisoma sp.]